MIGSWFATRRGEEEAPETETEAVIREVRQIEIGARRLMNSQGLGVYQSVFRGHGIEFSEVREYQPGDPFQSIDWKVTARMRRPFVKRFVEERERTVLLVVDGSGSTGFGSRCKLKSRLAVEVAGILILAAMRAQDRVGLLIFTDRCEKLVRPRRGRNRTLRLLYDMLSFKPEGKGTDLEGALKAAAQILPTRSLVFVVSDFMVPEVTGHADDAERQGQPGGLVRALAGLTHRHDVVAIEVRDPAEEALPEAGLVEVEDPETGHRRVLDLSDRDVRRGIEEKAAAERERFAAIASQAGAEWMSVCTDRSHEVDLHAFFAARERRKSRMRSGR